MSHLSELISRLCPEGVVFRRLADVARIRNGRDYKALGAGDVPVYGSGGIMTSVDTYAYDRPSVLIPRKGSLGNLFYVDTPFWTVDTIFYTEIYQEHIEPKFFYYFLKTLGLEKMNQAGGVPSQTQSALNVLRIPVPPLEVQREIVRILDTFTQLEAELEAELEARRHQYEHYRNSLLAFEMSDSIRWLALRELAGNGLFADGDWVESKDQDQAGEVRLTQLADVGVDAFRDRSDRWMREDQATRLGCTFLAPGDILIARMPDPLGRACQVPENIGRAVTVVDVAILRSVRPDVHARYVMYALNSHSVRRKILSFQTGGTRQRISRSNLGAIEIPLPAMSEQVRIVAILDKFDALVNDLSVGLPAELAARRKQYEYYRDRLLTFEEAV